MDSLSIPEVLEQVKRGQLRVPAFQRGFVWDAERIAYLMDSIHRKFPIGSLLLWRTREQLKGDRMLGPFHLPDPEVDYPIDYILDGQQRITSLFGVFQSELEQDNSIGWTNIYFDMASDAAAQDSRFLALSDGDVDNDRHFPLNAFFNTSHYGKLVRALDDARAELIDKVRETFQIAKIPYDSTSTTDRSTVAIIFERVNRQGIELDTFQLLTAWTWSEEFQLQEEFSDLTEDLKPFGFGEIGDDVNLLLRCCSAILTGDASPDALMNINGAELRDNFDRISNGVKYAIDYIKTNFRAEKVANLPFSTLIVPLSVYFAVPGTKEPVTPDAHRQQINRWFWRASFSKRYSSGVLRNLKSDIEEMSKLRDNKESSIDNIVVDVGPKFFLENVFGIGNVNSKTLILLLASKHPRSLISGQPVDLSARIKPANRNEYHHLMPRKFLADSGQAGGENNPSESALSNMAFLNRSENRELGGKAPSNYRKSLPQDLILICETNFIPDSLFNDDYRVFLTDRANALSDAAKLLID